MLKSKMYSCEIYKENDMNILHMKYAVEVAKRGSLNKAAEALLCAQPNISRSIKELENDLGITLFRRSAKGMEPTPEGAEFLFYAQSILKQIDEVETLYKNGGVRQHRLSVCTPCADYVLDAVMDCGDTVEIVRHGRDPENIADRVICGCCDLGIARCEIGSKRVLEKNFGEKGLTAEEIALFSCFLTVSKDSPLANADSIGAHDLNKLTEVARGDLQFSRSMPSESKGSGSPDQILIMDRSMRFEFLSRNANAFSKEAPASQKTLERYGLIQKEYTPEKKHLVDLLIYKKGYRPTENEVRFVAALRSRASQFINIPQKSEK